MRCLKRYLFVFVLRHIGLRIALLEVYCLLDMLRLSKALDLIRFFAYLEFRCFSPDE